MLDGNQMEEMTSAVELGVFAGDAVLALGRALRTGAVDPTDKPILERGLSLIEALRESEEKAVPAAGPRQLGLDGAGLEVLAAIEAEAPDADLDKFLEPLAKALKGSLEGEAANYVDELEVLRRVFIMIGDAEVARVSTLSQPGPPTPPTWQISQGIFGS